MSSQNKLIPNSLIFDKKMGCYLLPCKTFKIYYQTFDFVGGDCWIAAPNKPGYSRDYHAYTLLGVCEQIQHNHPELFTKLYKKLNW